MHGPSRVARVSRIAAATWPRPAASTRGAPVPVQRRAAVTSRSGIDVAAQTLIDLNSRTAAYQAALGAGASIVQTSLIDFLR